MVNSINSVNNPTTSNKTNKLLVAAMGVTGAMAGGLYAIKSMPETTSTDFLDKNDSHWLEELRNSCDSQKTKFLNEIGTLDDIFCEKMLTVSENISKTALLNGHIKELSESPTKSRNYDIAVKNLKQAKETLLKSIYEFPETTQYILEQINLFNKKRWDSAMQTHQENLTKLSKEKEFSVIKKVAGGAILGISIGLIINRLSKNSNSTSDSKN